MTSRGVSRSATAFVAGVAFPRSSGGTPLIRTLLAIAVVLTLAACGGDGTEGSTTEPPAEGGEAAAQREEPTVEIPEGDPPAELQVEDLIVGEGPAAEPGSTVLVHYVGVVWEDGTRFDASWDRGEPSAFSLNQVVPGFSRGISGEGLDAGPMRVGGRRQIVIPPELGYGEGGAPQAQIPGGATLVFVVDLLELPTG